MNKIESVIKSKETAAFRFKPTQAFFKELGIGKKRFWAMLRNEKQPTISEVKAIANILGVKPSDLVDIE